MRKGFTLIELLIVMAILAILFAAIVPMITASRKEARITKAKADLDAIKTGAMLLHYDTSVWPAVGNLGCGLINNYSGSGATSCTGSAISDWAGPYIDEWRKDPWNASYDICNEPVAGSTKRYVRSNGPNTVWGTCNSTGGNEDIILLLTPDYSK